jgi:predicted ferric reductase
MRPLQQPTKAVVLVIVYFTSLFFPVALIYLPRFPNNLDSLYSLGQALGLLAYGSLSWQLLLSSRIKLFERGVGLDRNLKLHRINSYLLLVSIILHPILLFWPQLITFKMPVYTMGHYLGILGLILVLVIMLTTIAGTRFKLRWKYWRRIHLIGYLVMFLGTVHSFLLGSHVADATAIGWWWRLMLLIVFMVIIHRIFRHFMAYTVRVLQVTRLSPTTTSITFTRPEGFEYYPGQFAFTKFKSLAVDGEEHHFTLSSSPTEKNLRMTIKALGDYTQQLYRVKKGDLIRLDGPYGIFSNAGHNGPFVFICGGIGITPVRAMLKYMHDSRLKIPVLLLYSAATKKDLVFEKELRYWAKRHPWFELRIYLTKEKRRGTYFGRISSKEIIKLSREQPRASYWISGPTAMVRIYSSLLRKAKIEKKRIFVEHFKLK